MHKTSGRISLRFRDSFKARCVSEFGLAKPRVSKLRRFLAEHSWMGSMMEFELVTKAITALSIEPEALTGLRSQPKGASLQGATSRFRATGEKRISFMR